MKNRKTVVVAFLLAAVMLLGVGYATLSDTLDITGSADVNHSALDVEFNNDIYFKSATANQTGNTASVNLDNNDKASFTASTLKAKGDKVTFTFVIYNESAHDVTVTPKLSDTLGNTLPGYFAISSDWNGQAKTIPAATVSGDTLTPGQISYEVTVELIDDPTDTISASFLIELNATANNSNDGSTAPTP